ncbi:MAG: DUF1254 domain-containing protein [Acidobacteria bacterium]|nr:DUF1254 domain-containing protein [Acidobacteriota bacterium]MCZ6879313.1 DUF1254 domain-containing protein [Acidobacteriota bacterium]
MALILCLPLATCSAQTDGGITEQEAYEIGIEAYVYLHPLITMDVTRSVVTNLPAGVKPGLGPKNIFHHMREFPTADFREVVRPNFDTLYSSAWLDLTKEPMVVSAQDTSGRHYLLPMLDMWSDVFAAPGKRTSGTKPANYAVVSPGWSGDLPRGMERIEAPTPHVWIIGRTQTNGPKDYEAVHKVQDGYMITPLSQWGKEVVLEKAEFDSTVDMNTPPAEQVLTMPAAKYFSYGAELMKVNRPHVTDWSTLARIKRIGIVPGESFDFAKASPAVKAALERAVVDGLQLMKDSLPSLAPVVNGWQMNVSSMGVYGNYYMKRAIVAMVGLGANQPEDAIYPLNLVDADGEPMEGGKRYILHFSKAELPPVDAFWSATMYDATGFQVANQLNRFAIGDRDALKYNADGSLDIYIQHDSPGTDKESNWLPSPNTGLLGLTMRLYAPKLQALDGRWVPPAIKKVQ